jgi:hypothetical protein
MPTTDASRTTTPGTMWSAISLDASTLSFGPLHWGRVAQKAMPRPTSGSSRARSGPGAATAVEARADPALGFAI